MSQEEKLIKRLLSKPVEVITYDELRITLILVKNWDIKKAKVEKLSGSRSVRFER